MTEAELLNLPLNPLQEESTKTDNCKYCCYPGHSAVAMDLSFWKQKQIAY
jgi:hypothetical protein